MIRTSRLRTASANAGRSTLRADSLLQIGLACWINSLWLLGTLIPAVALMSFVVIPREEHYLETRFPSEYLPYKAAVRRWL